MRFGCCADISRAEELHGMGFDYLECKVVSLQPECSENEYIQSVRPPYLDSPLPLEAWNVLLPGDLNVVGPNIDSGRIASYLSNAFGRIQELGGRVVVFGSGKARAIPDGFSRANANDQIADFVSAAGKIAADCDLTLVIEPLNTAECNVLTSVPEAAEMAKRVNHPAVKALADFYHMDEEQEPLEHIPQHRDWIAHVHTADTGRRAPGTGQYPYTRFAKVLQQAGYNERVSIECSMDITTEGPAALRFLQEQLG